MAVSYILKLILPVKTKNNNKKNLPTHPTHSVHCIHFIRYICGSHMFCVVQSNAFKDLISIWVHFLRKRVHCKLLTCKNNQYCALNSRKTSLAWLIYQL